MCKNGSGVVAIDDGGFSTGVVAKDCQEMFPSVKGLFGERTLTTAVGKYDFIVEYKGQKYVMGDLAKWDNAMPIQMHSRSKANLFFDLSVLVSVHQYGYLNSKIVVSVPIKLHNDEEKTNRINRLKGTHTIKVNGITKTFHISDVKVAPETASAYWIEQPKDKVRWIDLGSRTIGYSTTLNIDGVCRFIDTESGTFFGKGLEALDDKYDAKGLATFICGNLMKIFNENDKVYILGGGALDSVLVNGIKEYFPNSEVVKNPSMANAMGMYNLGRNAYGMA